MPSRAQLDSQNDQSGEVPSNLLNSSFLSNPSVANRLSQFDSLTSLEIKSSNESNTGRVQPRLALWANRVLIGCLMLFAVSVPHSIAAAETSLTLSLIAWIVRDISLRRIHSARTPIDLPLVCFAALTVLSSIFSVEPRISLPKLKSLTLFSIVYLFASNLSARGIRLLAALLIVSSLFSVGFSLTEKVWGRGMIVAEIDDNSVLAQSDLRPGDVIWMIARQRVFSTDQAAKVIRAHRTGDVLDVEALHAGDPVPVTLTVTDELKAKQNPLGITTNGRSRRFRISGFSRQFLTYAEQMQMLALLAFGAVLTAARLWRRRPLQRWLNLSSTLFLLFAFALILTASRSVIASLVVALVFVSISAGGWRAPVIALAAALLLGGLGFFAITSSRQQSTVNFNDDSAARRIGYMKAGLRLIPRHPLLGVGMDSHKRHWREWNFPGDYITHTHSTPIQIAMERGLPALFCYLWIIAAMLVAARRSYLSAKFDGDQFAESLSLGGFGAVIGFSASSLANYNFGDSESLMMLLCIFGLIAAQMQSRQVNAKRAS